MNHDCNGDYFTAEGIQYYRCHADSAVFPKEITEHCPNCGRYIQAEFHSTVSLITITEKIARLPDGREIILSKEVHEL